MNPLWSYAFALIGVAGMRIAARRPKLGWWINIGAQPLWITYAIVTRQWGFLASVAAYSYAYICLLREAYRPKLATEVT